VVRAGGSDGGEVAVEKLAVIRDTMMGARIAEAPRLPAEWKPR
jgi:hypothetical protein